MRIGIDITSENICAILLKNNKIVKTIEKPIYSEERGSEKLIMQKVLTSLHYIYNPEVVGIGVSLPSTHDKRRGVIYDLDKIPYWREIRIKQIIEAEFKIPVCINNDINCFIWAEKKYGICKDYNSFLGIILGPSTGTGFFRNDQPYCRKNQTFLKHKCLSEANYSYVRIYKGKYTKIIQQITFILDQLKNDLPETKDHYLWSELGINIGKLISTLLDNYDPQIIVLGGNLSKSYINYVDAMDKYLEEYLHPADFFNTIIISSVINHPRALGAASLIPDQSRY